MARVTIFHTSDMHNKLTLDLANRLHDLKQAHPDSLMLDSGDAIWSGNIYWRPGGEPILDLMNSVPYDAMCMGNREFHFLESGINSKTSRADFPIVSANLRRANSPEETAGALSFLTFHPKNLRVTVFALSVPCITERMLVKKVSDYYFVQPMKAAAELVPMLRKESDILIALTHIGIQQDRELAENVPGIDIILGGHTHTITDKPERVGDTTILHSGMYAHHVRQIELVHEAGKTDVKSELIPLGKA